MEDTRLGLQTRVGKIVRWRTTEISKAAQRVSFKFEVGAWHKPSSKSQLQYAVSAHRLRDRLWYIVLTVTLLFHLKTHTSPIMPKYVSTSIRRSTREAMSSVAWISLHRLASSHGQYVCSQQQQQQQHKQYQQLQHSA